MICNVVGVSEVMGRILSDGKRCGEVKDRV